MSEEAINQERVLQLATVCGDQPWICTVYFVVHAGNFYWLSFPGRRHSLESADNPRAAVAIAFKQDMPVQGLQAEGNVSEVKAVAEAEVVLEKYTAKYQEGGRFIDRFKSGKNQHALYCLTPRKVMLFDELNHPDTPYQEIMIGG